MSNLTLTNLTDGEVIRRINVQIQALNNLQEYQSLIIGEILTSLSNYALSLEQIAKELEEDV